ncbi:DNA/RNA helicase domain-containing protein, partial [Pseudomonadota bacterium]
VYFSKLTNSFKQSHIKNLFKGSGAYTNCESNIFDALIVDEAHRLNEKSGLFQNLGENQIKEIISAAKFSVFFIDEDQRVTFKDIGEKEEIRGWANRIGATVHDLELSSQFRCNGSDGYLAWIDHALQIRETANETLEGIDYDFSVFDSPNHLRDAIFKKNRINNKARLVAGYCWDWVSKKNPSQKDITINEYDFSMRWNLASNGNLWIVEEESIAEIGCIHTCQGLELDYIGVIIGPDLIVRDGHVITDAAQRSKMDSSVKGYKKLLKEQPEQAKARADTIIKNTYRTLMTRGQKGCYLYCTDSETNAYFQAAIQSSLLTEAVYGEDDSQEIHQQDDVLPFRKLGPGEIRPYENCVPLYNLEVAAGQFSQEQAVDECEWVELPDVFKAQKGLFVTQVVGESMNRRIPNGSWCLFRLAPGGSRQGKVVLVQNREIHDVDTGGHYTVKVYESEKMANEEGESAHRRIVLKPDTTLPGYEPLVFEGEEEGVLVVIAELVAVLG